MKDILIGMAVGDAVGVPYEFIPKSIMDKNPATDMIGFGTHNQPKGTWSDDTSMALCLADSLCSGLNYDDIAKKFFEWFYENKWTAHGVVFDHGFATADALDRYIRGIKPVTECGGKSERSNGNGSVMRTLALIPFIENLTFEERYEIISNVSSITHGHWISKLSCFMVCEFAINLRKGQKNIAWENTIDAFYKAQKIEGVTDKELKEYFGLYLMDDWKDYLNDNHFSGSGFARDTAVTSIWCIVTTSSYEEAVLKAVNYGDDTDTTACVVGGLAGCFYGSEDIPMTWLDSLVKKDEIEALSERYETSKKVC